MEEKELDAYGLGPTGEKFYDFAMTRMKGQEKAIRRLAKAVDHAESPLRDRTKPIYVCLLVGGAGSGKMHLIRLLAEFWFGNPGGFISVACSDFKRLSFTQNLLNRNDFAYQFHHGAHKDDLQLSQQLTQERDELAKALNAMRASLDQAEDPEVVSGLEKLIAEKEALLMEKISAAQQQWEKIQPVLNGLKSIFVLEHIEHADHETWEALCDPLGSAEHVFHTSDGANVVSFANSVIFITCSDWVPAGAKGLTHDKIGFRSHQGAVHDAGGKDVHLSGTEELKNYLSAKILSRITRIEFLRPYAPESPDSQDPPKALLEIVDLFLGNLEERLMKTGFPVMLQVAPEVKRFIVTEGSDHPEMGIRLLRHKFDKYITWQLENLVQKKLVQPKDMLQVSLEDGKEKKKGKKIVVFRKADIPDVPR